MKLSTFSLLGSILTTSTMAVDPNPPTKYGMVVFPNFQALDVFGPLDILNMLSMQRKLDLSILSTTLDPVSTKPQAMNTSGSNFGESVVPTHTFATAPKDLEVLIVPGGGGTRGPHVIAPAVEYVKQVYPNLRYLITVCTGSALVAKSGVLDGKRATSNKRAWAWATAQGPKVHWIAKARWVVDGNIWTSSGVSAGMDVTYAFVADIYGEQIAQDLADGAEYFRNTDPDNDPFAERWNATQPPFPGPDSPTRL